MTILALACCLVTGVAVAAVISRDGLPTVSFIASPPPPVEAEPTANRDRKADRLPMQTAARPPGGEGGFPKPAAEGVAPRLPRGWGVFPARRAGCGTAAAASAAEARKPAHPEELFAA